MPTPEYLPHINLLLQALHISRERLNGKTKVAIDARLLRSLIQAIVARVPFDSQFYFDSYPDIAAAHAAGKLPDPQRHFIEVGFFEGRLGSPPPIDEAYYTNLYKDVGQAVARGDIASATEHYLRQGSSEGRIPSRQIKPEVDYWVALMREDARST